MDLLAVASIASGTVRIHVVAPSNKTDSPPRLLLRVQPYLYEQRWRPDELLVVCDLLTPACGGGLVDGEERREHVAARRIEQARVSPLQPVRQRQRDVDHARGFVEGQHHRARRLQLCSATRYAQKGILAAEKAQTAVLSCRGP
eukprot:2202600-Pleurochrysis_carterae.AAC.3